MSTEPFIQERKISQSRQALSNGIGGRLREEQRILATFSTEAIRSLIT